MKRIRIANIIVLVFLLGPVAVYGADVTMDNDVTLVLPTDASSYTLTGNSSFDSLTVNTSNFSFSMSNGQSAKIISADKKNFTVSPTGPSVECGTSQSSVVISVPGGSPSQTVTVTPSSTCTAVAAGGGGGIFYSSGGGGGGGGGGTTTAAPVPVAKPAVTPTTPVPAAPAVSSIPTVIINRALNVGATGADVRILQQYLASDPQIYPEKLVTGYFGLKTRVAVQRFQEKYGIAKKGDAGYGLVGPKTRAKLKELSQSGKSAAAPSAVSNEAKIKLLQEQLKVLLEQLKLLQKK